MCGGDEWDVREHPQVNAVAGAFVDQVDLFDGQHGLQLACEIKHLIPVVSEVFAVDVDATP